MSKPDFGKPAALFMAPEMLHDSSHGQGSTHHCPKLPHSGKVSGIQIQGRDSLKDGRKGFELGEEQCAPALVEIDEISNAGIGFGIICPVLPPMVGFCRLMQSVSKLAFVLLQLLWLGNAAAASGR